MVSPKDAPKLGLILSNGADKEPMVATPLTLPMGWKKSPPLFCTATERVANIANEPLRSRQPSRPQKIDNRVEAIAPPPEPLLAEEHVKLTHNPYLRPPKANLLAYVNVFVADFLGLAQGPRHHHRHVHHTLFHTLDMVFRPLDQQDTKHSEEVPSIKKLKAGDCSCSTCQTMLGFHTKRNSLIPSCAIPNTDLNQKSIR